MKTSKIRFLSGMAISLVVGLMSTGCVFEWLSWSPDGRYLASAAGDSDRLYLIDTKTQEVRPFEINEAMGCAFLPSGEDILVIDGDGDALVRLHWPTGEIHLLAEDVGFDFDISADGRFVYYLRENKDDELIEIWEQDIRKPDRKERIFRTAGELAFLELSPDQKRILLSVGIDDDPGSLWVLDRDSGTTRTLIGGEGMSFWSPRWIDDKRVMSVRISEAEDLEDGVGHLIETSIDGETTRTIRKYVSAMTPPSLSPDRRSVAVTVCAESFARGKTDIPKEGSQVAVLDIETGGVLAETDEPFSAISPAFHPSGGSVAFMYVTGVYQWDLASGAVTGLWRTEEEKYYMKADGLFREGKVNEAAEAFRSFLEQYPDSEIKDFASYRLMTCYLDPAAPDPAAAVRAFEKIKEQDLKKQALTLYSLQLATPTPK